MADETKITSPTPEPTPNPTEAGNTARPTERPVDPTPEPSPQPTPDLTDRPIRTPTEPDFYEWAFYGVYTESNLECTFEGNLTYKTEIHNCCLVDTTTLVDEINCDASTKPNDNAVACTSSEVPECDSDCAHGIVSDDEICDTNGVTAAWVWPAKCNGHWIFAYCNNIGDFAHENYLYDYIWAYSI